MGIINVEGLGSVEIEGKTPTKDEQEKIWETLQDISKEYSGDEEIKIGVSTEQDLGTQTVIPDIISPDVPQSKQGLEYIGGRPTFEATGAIFGSVPGTALGPAGMVAGGVLGSAGSGQLYDIVQSYLVDEPTTLGTQAEALKKDLSREGLLQTFFSKIPGMGKWIKSGLVKKDPQTKALYESAKRLGYPLSLSDAGNIISKGYGRVVGIFPFVGTPIKKGLAEKSNILNKKADDVLNIFAPNVSLTKLGMDMTKASKSTFDDFKRVSGFLYDDFYKTASKAKAPIVPTKNFKSSLQAYIKLIDDGAIKIGKKGKTLDTPQKDALYNYAKSALRIPNNINANQYRALVNDIRKFSMKSQKEGFDLKALTGWKSGLEKDLNILSTPGYASKRIDPTLAAEIAKKLKFANKVYANGLENSIVVKIGKDKVKLSPTIGIKKFDTPIAKKFKMVDKNIFGAGFERQGSITADQLGNTLLKSSNLTPQLLDDLKGLVGKKQYDRFVRQVFQKAYNKSVVTTREGGMNGLMFDPHKFEDLIGLTTKDGRALVKEMLKDSPLTLQKLDDFFAVAKNHVGLNIPDVSSFVARRATLGGTKSIFGGVAMGYSTFNNPIRSLGVVYLARKGSGILNNPKILDDVMTVMDYNAPGYKIYNSALKLIDGLLSENEQKNMRQTEINGLTEYKEFILENKDKILKGMTDE